MKPVQCPSPGQAVKWFHYDRRGTKDFTGKAIEPDPNGRPYWKVRRDDTGKIHLVRTSVLRPL